MADARPRSVRPAASVANLCAAAATENPHSRQKNSGRAPWAACPLLARALTVALRLVGIDLAHFFQQIFRVRPRNVRRARPAAVALFRPPRSRIKWFLNALRHAQKFRRERPKGKLRRSDRLPLIS